jgi:hypothetical protein
MNSYIAMTPQQAPCQNRNMRAPPGYLIVHHDTAPETIRPETRPASLLYPIPESHNQHHRHHFVPAASISRDTPPARHYRFETSPTILYQPFRVSDLRTDGQGEDIIDNYIRERGPEHGTSDIYDYLMQQRENEYLTLVRERDQGTPLASTLENQSDSGDEMPAQDEFEKSASSVASSGIDGSHVEHTISHIYEDILAEFEIISLAMMRVLDAQVELFRTVREGVMGVRGGRRRSH